MPTNTCYNNQAHPDSDTNMLPDNMKPSIHIAYLIKRALHVHQLLLKHFHIANLIIMLIAGHIEMFRPELVNRLITKNS